MADNLLASLGKPNELSIISASQAFLKGPKARA
jgi:hypothetical protein